MAKQVLGRKLLSAILEHDTDTTTSLIKKGADFSVEYRGDKAVHLAARNGMLDVVKLLHEKGADVQALNINKNSALHYASRFGYMGIVDYVIKKGANKNAQNEDGDTPLHFAVINQPMDVIEELVKRGMRVNSKNAKGETPLHAAVSFSRLEAVEALLLCGADLDVKDKSNKTPTDHAKQSNLSNQLRGYSAMAMGVSAGYIQAKGMKFDHRFVETPQKISRVGIILESMDLEKNCPVGFYCRRERSENSSVTLSIHDEEEIFSDVFHMRTSDYAKTCCTRVKLPLYMPPSEKDEMLLKFMSCSEEDRIVHECEKVDKVNYLTMTVELVPGTTLICVILVRPRKEENVLGEESAQLTSAMEKHFKIDVQEGTFDKDTVLSLTMYDNIYKMEDDDMFDEEDIEAEEGKAAQPTKGDKTKNKAKQSTANKASKDGTNTQAATENDNGDSRITPPIEEETDDIYDDLLKTDLYQITIKGEQPKKSVFIQVPLKGMNVAGENADDIVILTADENDLDRENALEVVPTKPKIVNCNLVFEVPHFCIYTATARKKIKSQKELAIIQNTIANTKARKKRANFFVVVREDSTPRHTIVVECNNRSLTRHRLKRWLKQGNYEAQSPSYSGEIMLTVGDAFCVELEGNAAFQSGFNPKKSNKIVFSNGRESYQAYPITVLDTRGSPEATVVIKRTSSSINVRDHSSGGAEGGIHADEIIKLPITLHLPRGRPLTAAERRRYRRPSMTDIDV